MHNIYLIGMMGAGKTAIGKALASLAEMAFVDLDEEIEGQTHLTINEIFAKKGESYFRSEEKKILRETVQQTNVVVATGGGILLDPANVERMRQTGKVIYLEAPFETLWKRVQDKQDRPLLSVPDPKATFYQLFLARRPLYEGSSHFRVETQGRRPEAVAREIVDKYLK